LVVIKSFIHGNAVIPEIVGPGPFVQIVGCPWSELLGYCAGYGKAFRGGSGKSTWFHSAVPTPPVQYSRVQLDKVFLFFNAETGCFMTDVHIWDGPDSVSTISSLNTSGDNLRNPTERNSFNIRIPPGNSLHTMNYGLGISMHFRFDSESVVMFTSVGADFSSTD
jgi:hypothetical protein